MIILNVTKMARQQVPLNVMQKGYTVSHEVSLAELELETVPACSQSQHWGAPKNSVIKFNDIFFPPQVPQIFIL